MHEKVLNYGAKEARRCLQFKLKQIFIFILRQMSEKFIVYEHL